MAHCFLQNAHLVTSSAAQDGVFWLPEDVMARLTVMMIVMKMRTMMMTSTMMMITITATTTEV